jgi:hypothetical protein
LDEGDLRWLGPQIFLLLNCVSYTTEKMKKIIFLDQARLRSSSGSPAASGLCVKTLLCSLL